VTEDKLSNVWFSHRIINCLNKGYVNGTFHSSALLPVSLESHILSEGALSDKVVRELATDIRAYYSLSSCRMVANGFATHDYSEQFK
jgi:hypothetical protein